MPTVAAWTCEPVRRRRRGAARGRARRLRRATAAILDAARAAATPTARARFLAGADRTDPFALPGWPPPATRSSRHVAAGLADRRLRRLRRGRRLLDGDHGPRAAGARRRPALAAAEPRRGLRAVRGGRARAGRGGRRAAGHRRLRRHGGRRGGAARRARPGRGRDRPPPAGRRAARTARSCIPALGERRRAELCAAGVALKLSEALRERGGPGPGGAEEDLDLAGLATVCDMVPLRGENRRIAREGLAALARTAQARAARADARRRAASRPTWTRAPRASGSARGSTPPGASAARRRRARAAAHRGRGARARRSRASSTGSTTTGARPRCGSCARPRPRARTR